VQVRGTVQGVGFRPWVWRLAHELGLSGRVRNDADGVHIEAWGAPADLDALCARLVGEEAPQSARVEAVDWQLLGEERAGEESAGEGFAIIDSRPGAARSLSIPADLAPCPDCLRELRDPTDRRYRYAFINCTACGPRFTLVTGLPWDRPRTTMAGFPLCPRCRAEYQDPADRRFHAQPVACPDCGPRLRLLDAAGQEQAGDALEGAAAWLRAGGIVAVHGVGGFQLACDATDPAAAARLRAGKRRPAKPFALMVADLDAARALARLTPAEAALLASPARPIVLLQALPDGPLAPAVAPGCARLGLMLPSSPLHYLLLDAVGRPLVMSSGNRSGGPILTTPQAALAELGAGTGRDAGTPGNAVAERFLVHDRPIASRCDDSVAAVLAGRPTLLRRARGFVPRPVRLARPMERPVLAVGALLQAAPCLAVGDQAWLGPHVGDLDEERTMAAMEEAVARLEGLLGVRAEVLAHDLHPDLPSTRWAQQRPALARVGVQHHHAHVAAVLAEHRVAGPALALAWDGVGMGSDGGAWGGELLLADAGGFARLATISPLPLAGGDQAVHEPWRLALALLYHLGVPTPERPPFTAVPAARRLAVGRLLDSGVACPPAHGMGRWFDAVGSLLTGRPTAADEAQLAVALEDLAGQDGFRADPSSPRPTLAGTTLAPLPFRIDDQRSPWLLDLWPAARALVAAWLDGASPARLAARFHQTLVAAGVALLVRARQEHGPLPVVLAGGCFCNARLVDGLTRALPRELRLLRAEQVPPGDGGLALGQVLVADAVQRAAHGS